MKKNNELRRQVLALLEAYPDKVRQINILNYELIRAAGLSEDELIGQMALPGHRDGPGVYSGQVSDKTMYIALNYRDQLEKLLDENIDNVYKELDPLKEEIDRLHTYVGQLDRRSAEIVTLYYFEELSWAEIEKMKGITVKGLQNRRNRAVDKLTEFYALSGKTPALSQN